MSTLTDRTIAALRASNDALSATVRTLDDADLDRPSGSAAWDVAQVLSHMGSASEIGLASLRSALAGEPSPGMDANQVVWDRWDALGQRAKADGFLEWSERLVTAYEDLDEATRRDVRFRLDFMPQPVDAEFMTGLLLNEHAMHAWDVNVAFDPAAAVPAVEAGVLLDQQRGSLGVLLGFLGKPAGLDGATADLRVVTGEPDREFGLAISQSVGLVESPVAPDGVVLAPTEAFVRLLAGRLTPEYTPVDVAVEGSAVTLDQLRRVFPGF